MKYKVRAKFKTGEDYLSDLPIVSIDYAIAEAETLKNKSNAVTILRDDEGVYHPDNNGKYFLHLIVK